jgi:hypothetical protein
VAIAAVTKVNRHMREQEGTQEALSLNMLKGQSCLVFVECWQKNAFPHSVYRPGHWNVRSGTEPLVRVCGT